jgi:hypothetical protein
MPRTKSTREDTRTPLEKLERHADCKITLLIFFQYYDGYLTNGQVGFNPEHPPGSVKHKRPMKIFDHLSDSKFRGKAQKLAILAKGFVDENRTPPPELRPRFDREIPMEELVGNQPVKKTPLERLADVKDATDLFIFFQYYDGYDSDGRIGFNPGSGPPGSVNHKRSFTRLDSVAPSAFRKKGRELGNLAKEFKELGVNPPPNIRPQFVPQLPLGMLLEAANAGFF